uniref:Uncharacterized protein n=1 Tax=Leersia perrieri TaxID=77586 RepID=A0A0D9WE25_9ORYZ
MGYPTPRKLVKHTRDHQDNKEALNPDRLVGAIISDLEASITPDGEDSYSASKPDNSRGNDTASTSATPAQRLAAMQQILDETLFNTAENPELVSWADQLRENARNLDSTFREAQTEAPEQPTESEVARRATAANAGAPAQAIGQPPNTGVLVRPTIEAVPANGNINTNNEVADEEPADEERRIPRGRANRAQTPPADHHCTDGR